MQERGRHETTERHDKMKRQKRQTGRQRRKSLEVMITRRHRAGGYREIRGEVKAGEKKEKLAVEISDGLSE